MADELPGLAWLHGPVTTAAWCWQLLLQDDTVYGFTSHDQDLTIDGVVYEASTGFIPTAVDTSNSMAVDNMDVEGFLSSDRITVDDLFAGRYDNAAIQVFICNWSDLTLPMLTLRKGTIGQVSHNQSKFVAEVRGMLEPYQQEGGKVTQKTCRAVLGDIKCKVNMVPYTVSGTVATVNANGTFTTDLTQADAYFDYGTVTFTSGQNHDLSYEIRRYLNAGGYVDAFLPTMWPVIVGDTFTIKAGCDGNFSTCKHRFGNTINFRAEPHLPGNDYLASYPNSGTANTVRSGNDPGRRASW